MSRARFGAGPALLFALLTMSPASQAQAPALAFDSARAVARFDVHPRVPMRSSGRFTRVSGELQGDAGSGWVVHVQIDGSSLKYDGPAWMGRITRSEDFLAVDRYPAIGFTSLRFADSLLHKGGKLRGELQLRGLRRDVGFQLLPSTCARPGHDCDIQVRGSISRRAFGMTSYRLTLRDDVDFSFNVRFRAEPTS